MANLQKKYNLPFLSLLTLLFWILLSLLIAGMLSYLQQDLNKRLIFLVAGFSLSQWLLSLFAYQVIDWCLARKRWLFILGTALSYGILFNYMFPAFYVLIGRLFQPFNHILTLSGSLNPILLTIGFLSYIFPLVIIIHFQKTLKNKQKAWDKVELLQNNGSLQLAQIKSRIQPHFLFNALNTISMMIRQKKNSQSVNMIANLSDLLRDSLAENPQTQMITLQKEIQMLKKYLSIEQERLGADLQIDWQVDNESLKIKVPQFILQPLVENAFKHAFKYSTADYLLKISSKITDDYLHLSIFNSGEGLKDNWELQRSKGTGFTLVIDRLMLLYQGNFSFNIHQQENGLMIKIKLPVGHEI